MKELKKLVTHKVLFISYHMIRLEILIIIFILDNMNNQIKRQRRKSTTADGGGRETNLIVHQQGQIRNLPSSSLSGNFLSEHKPNQAETTGETSKSTKHPPNPPSTKKLRQEEEEEAAAARCSSRWPCRRGPPPPRCRRRPASPPSRSKRFVSLPSPSLSLSISLGFLEKMAPLAIASAKDQIFFVPGWTSIEPFCSCLAFNQMGGGGGD